MSGAGDRQRNRAALLPLLPLLALKHGVPMVVAPNAEDKPEVAARVAHFGVGVNLHTAHPSVAAIADAVQRILDEPGYRTRASALSDALGRYSALETIEEELDAAVAKRFA